jgi:hypothetical protein
MNGTKAIARWFDVYAYRVGRPDNRKIGIIFTDITNQVRDEERKMENGTAEGTGNTTCVHQGSDFPGACRHRCGRRRHGANPAEI